MTSIDPKRFRNQELFRAQIVRIYDSYRTALFKRKYYGYRLITSQQWNLAYECVLALGSSSVIAGWAIWKIGFGEYVWAIIAGLVAVLAILKPFLQLSKSIEQHSQSYVGWSAIYLDIREVVLDIQTKRIFTEEMLKLFSAAEGRIKKLDLSEEPKLIEGLKQRCVEEVKKDIPSESLWDPIASRLERTSPDTEEEKHA